VDLSAGSNGCARSGRESGGGGGGVVVGGGGGGGVHDGG